MPLLRLKMNAVRCLQNVDMQLHAGRNHILGENGAGKTSLLEGTFLLGRGRSFRSRQTRRLVQRGARSLAVYGETLGGDRIGVSFADGSLRCQINGDLALGLVELSRTLLVHVIDPSSHGLVEGGPSVRRRYLDASVFHVEHSYLEEWRQYRRVLGQRNAALKNGHKETGLDVWTRQLIELGEIIDARRSGRAAELGAQCAVIGERLLGRQIQLEYRRGWRQDASLSEALQAGLERDQAAGFTQLGPHRADLRLRMEGAPVRDVASRGQQKLVAAALVLAEVRVAADRLGHGGVLLVDDPAAELDSGALERLLEELEGLDVQLLITAISSASLPALQEAAVFHVEQGKVQAVV